MAGNKYIQLDTTGLGNVEKNSVQSSTDTPASGDIVALSTGAKIHADLLNVTVTSAGAADSAKIVTLNSSGRLDSTVLPAGIGESQTMTASEALTAGNWINVWNDTGTFKVRKADGSATGKPADGFVLSAIASGATGTVYFEGMNDQLTGLTAGAVFLSTATAGASQQTVPSGSGKVSQVVGRAISATTVQFERGVPTLLV